MSEQARVADLGVAWLDDQWRSLAHGRPALRLEVIRAIAAHGRRRVDVAPVLLEIEGGLGGIAVVRHETGADGPISLDSILFGRLAPIARAFGMTTAPALVVAPPLSSGGGFLVHADGPEQEHRRIAALLDAVESRAADSGAALALPAVLDSETTLIGLLRSRGYVETDVDPIATMRIEWTDFSGYVRHLARRSASAAQSARRERRRAEASGLVIRRADGPHFDHQGFETLVRAHYRRKNGRDPLHGPGFFRALSAALGADFIVYEAWRGDRRVAMTALVRADGVGWASWFGIDREAADEDFAYFNLCYYHLADVAASLGIHTLQYGMGAYAAKLRRGCTLERCRLFYRPRSRLARPLARWALALRRAWLERKPR